MEYHDLRSKLVLIFVVMIAWKLSAGLFDPHSPYHGDRRSIAPSNSDLDRPAGKLQEEGCITPWRLEYNN
jgi:hypothetical protein